MFDPWSFAIQADRLNNQSSALEDDYRSAVSRAYYACYLTAREQMFGLNGEKMPRHNGSPHAYLIAAMQNTVLSQQLQQLKYMRESADYDTADSKVRTFFRFNRISHGWQEVANRAIAMANQMYPSLAQLPPATQ